MIDPQPALLIQIGMRDIGQMVIQTLPAVPSRNVGNPRFQLFLRSIPRKLKQHEASSKNLCFLGLPTPFRLPYLVFELAWL